MPIPADDISWREALAVCLAHLDELDERSQAFVRRISPWRGTPSERQLDWLYDLYERVTGGGR
jgi:hypothetical protein